MVQDDVNLRMCLKEYIKNIIEMLIYMVIDVKRVFLGSRSPLELR